MYQQVQVFLHTEAAIVTSSQEPIANEDLTKTGSQLYPTQAFQNEFIQLYLKKQCIVMVQTNEKAGIKEIEEYIDLKSFATLISPPSLVESANLEERISSIQQNKRKALEGMLWEKLAKLRNKEWQLLSNVLNKTKIEFTFKVKAGSEYLRIEVFPRSEHEEA